MSARTLLVDLFNERSNFNIISRKAVFFVLSGLFILAGLVSLATRGLNLGIDFEGGTAWQVDVAEGDPSVSEVRDLMSDLGYSTAKITEVGDSGVRVQAEVEEEADKNEVSAALAEYAGIPAPDVSFQDVGPTFGDEVTEKAVRALVFFLLAVSLYLALRFETKIAIASLAALFHDLLVTVGVYSLTGFEVTPATVIAVLTILGYSLYDNVVVFDKVAENAAALGTSGRETYSAVVNRSLNEVLMRSLNTSITTLIPVLALLLVGSGLLGAVGIRDFALALFVGLLSGTYSSIFTAAPVLAVLKEREPKYRQLRERVEQRLATTPKASTPAPAPAPAPAAAPAPAPEAEGPAPAPAPAPAPEAPRPAPRPGSPAPVQPRGRQQRRKKRRR